MTISYPISLPSSFCMAHITIRQSTVVGVSASPFTGEQQVYAHQGQWWEAEVTLPPMKRDDAEDVLASFMSLNGRQGTFLMGVQGNSQLRGVGGGSPQVDGASQVGLVLNVKGLPSSTSGVWKAGDWIQLGSGSSSRLHKVITVVNSDPSGKAAVNIWPRLRYSPANSAAIYTSNTVGQWRMSSNQQEYDISPGMIYGYTFAAQEAL